MFYGFLHKSDNNLEFKIVKFVFCWHPADKVENDWLKSWNVAALQ
jgi:hypothetical protein